MKFTSLVVAGLLLAGQAAHAASVSSPVETLTLATGKNSVTYGNTFSSVAAGDTFADRFNFTLTGTSDFNFTVVSTAAVKNTGLDLTSYNVYDLGTNALVATGTKNYVNLAGKFDKYTLTFDDLAAGSYYFQVTGTMLSSGGSFSANGNITVSPVPEPAMPAMLLGGLAVLGFAARRKVK